MRNELNRFIKKQWLLIWLCTSAFLLTSMIVSAEYGVKTNKMNRVIRSVATQGMMFSSNYLVEGGEKTYIAKYVSTNGSYDIGVYIWNYSIDNISKWYPSNIKYTFTAKLTDNYGNELSADAIGSNSLQILDSNESELVTLDSLTRSYTSPVQTLNYDVAHSDEDMFIVRYPSDWDLDNMDFCVTITASPYRYDEEGQPDNSVYKDLKDISAVLGLKELVNTNSKGWQAYISEERANKNITDCDAYNVVVTGSGNATITLTWDTRYLDFNEYFYNSSKSIYNFGSDEVVHSTSGDTATITINADTGSSATSHRNRYDIQLYKIGEKEFATWDELKQYVTLSVLMNSSGN